MTHFIFRNSWWAIRKRPKIKIGITLFDLIIEIAGLVALLTLWIVLMVNYSGLPDAIPLHFNGAGQVDHFGGKNSIFILPVIATVLFAGMTILSRFPHVINYPVRITEKNAFLQYRNMARMVRCLTLTIILFFGSLVFHLILYSGENAEGQGLGIWFIPVSLAIIIIPVIYFMVKSFIYR